MLYEGRKISLILQMTRIIRRVKVSCSRSPINKCHKQIFKLICVTPSRILWHIVVTLNHSYDWHWRMYGGQKLIIHNPCPEESYFKEGDTHVNNKVLQGYECYSRIIHRPQDNTKGLVNHSTFWRQLQLLNTGTIWTQSRNLCMCPLFR